MHVVLSAAAALAAAALATVQPAAAAPAAAPLVTVQSPAAGGAGFSRPDAGPAGPSLQQQQQQNQQEEPPPPPAQVAGKWTVSLDMAMGTATVGLEFKQDEGKITGTYSGRYGAFPLEGTVKGRAIEFVVTTTIEGQQSSLWFGGEVAEDGQTMKGPAELGGAGEAYWTAKRAK